MQNPHRGETGFQFPALEGPSCPLCHKHCNSAHSTCDIILSLFYDVYNIQPPTNDNLATLKTRNNRPVHEHCGIMLSIMLGAQSVSHNILDLVVCVFV